MVYEVNIMISYWVLFERIFRLLFWNDVWFWQYWKTLCWQVFELCDPVFELWELSCHSTWWFPKENELFYVNVPLPLSRCEISVCESRKEGVSLRFHHLCIYTSCSWWCYLVFTDGLAPPLLILGCCSWAPPSWFRTVLVLCTVGVTSQLVGAHCDLLMDFYHLWSLTLDWCGSILEPIQILWMPPGSGSWLRPSWCMWPEWSACWLSWNPTWALRKGRVNLCLDPQCFLKLEMLSRRICGGSTTGVPECSELV